MTTPERTPHVDTFVRPKEGMPYVLADESMQPTDTPKPLKTAPEERVKTGEDIAQETAPRNWRSNVKE